MGAWWVILNLLNLLISFFREASDWEAKFYQIQSKYLLLLNELHNPQVSVSASRQEMVGQLLKDIVEAAERPNLTSASGSSFDPFGFRIENLEPEASLEDKAERLRRQAEQNSENASAEASYFDPLGRPTVTRPVGIIVFAHVLRSYLRNVPKNLVKQYKVKTMFPTGETAGLVEWIIDDTCLVFTMLLFKHNISLSHLDKLLIDLCRSLG